MRDVAMHVASLYFADATVVVEDASTAPPEIRRDTERVALVWTEFSEKDGVSEVHLSYDGRVGIGLSTNGPLIGGAEATLAALRELGYEIPCYLMAVSNVHTSTGWPVIVTLRSTRDGTNRIGIAQANGDLVAAAKATLDALNRDVAAITLP